MNHAVQQGIDNLIKEYNQSSTFCEDAIQYLIEAAVDLEGCGEGERVKEVEQVLLEGILAGKAQEQQKQALIALKSSLQETSDYAAFFTERVAEQPPPSDEEIHSHPLFKEFQSKIWVSLPFPFYPFFFSYVREKSVCATNPLPSK